MLYRPTVDLQIYDEVTERYLWLLFRISVQFLYTAELHKHSSWFEWVTVTPTTTNMYGFFSNIIYRVKGEQPVCICAWVKHDCKTK